MLHIASKTYKMTQKSARLSAIYTSIVLETAFISIPRIKFENFLSTYYQTILNSPRPREQPLWNNGQIPSKWYTLPISLMCRTSTLYPWSNSLEILPFTAAVHSHKAYIEPVHMTLCPLRWCPKPVPWKFDSSYVKAFLHSCYWATRVNTLYTGNSFFTDT